MKKIVILLVLLIFLSGCEYSPSKHDVVNTHGKIENLELLEKFIEDVSMNKDSVVRVINYTDEGDPIIHDLIYYKEKLTSIKDTREDDFGDKLVIENECETIKKIDKDNQTRYQLEGCKGEEDIIFVTTIVNQFFR